MELYQFSLQFTANLVLHETIERIHIDKQYGDIPRGIFLVRGENVVLAGEIDPSRENAAGLTRVTIEEILALQRERAAARERVDEVRNRALTGRGLAPKFDLMHEDVF